MDDNEIGLRVELIEVDPKSDTLTREVHKGLRFHEDYLGPVVERLSDEGLAGGVGFSHSSAIPPLCDLVDDEKSDIMFGQSVLRSGVTESDDEFHSNNKTGKTAC